MVVQPDIGVEIRHWLKILTYATLALYLALGCVVFYVWFKSRADSAELRREEQKTSAALCTPRHDLEIRVANTKEFGIPGIPPKIVKSQIKTQESTIHALDILVCPVGTG